MDTAELVDKWAGKAVEALAKTAPEAWATMVRGTFVEGVVTLTLLFIFWTVWLFAWVKNWNKSTKSKDDEEAQGAIAVILGIVGLIIFCVSVFAVSEALVSVVSPEYIVTKNILSRIR